MKACWYCKKAHQNYGFAGDLYEPPEPASAECYDEKYVILQETEEDPAPHCEGYNPVQAVCGNCKAPCGDMAEVTFFAYDENGDRIPVCSKDCQESFDLKTKVKENAMKEALAEARAFQMEAVIAPYDWTADDFIYMAQRERNISKARCLNLKKP
jgi:hypothetical protein